MNYEWDENKSNDCFTKRGFDFAFVIQAFLDPFRIFHQDTRMEYGEERYQMLGMIDKRVFVVIYTLRGKNLRIISARKANKRELIHYENSQNYN